MGGILLMADMTKQALGASLKRLLLTKPVTKITIHDIAEDCGISRGTFYYHFQDIYDLVEWTTREDARRVMEGNRSYDTWQQGFLNIFHAVEENKPFILNVYRHVSREQIEQFLYQVVYGLLRDVVEERSAGMTVKEEDKRFIADFYKYAFVGLMLNWIQGDMKEDPEAIIARLILFLERKSIKKNFVFALKRQRFQGFAPGNETKLLI